MPKRVQQPDGTYCYTENCKIHDRGTLPTVGGPSLVADVRRMARQNGAHHAALILQDHANLLGRKKDVHEISRELIDRLYNTESATIPTVANIIRLAAHGDKVPTGREWEAMYDLGHRVYVDLVDERAMRTGDRVVIAKTGERGRVTEAGFGRVRVDLEGNPTRNFQWYEAGQAIKIPIETAPASARERIAYASPDYLIDKGDVKQVCYEETDPATYNAQALRGLTDTQGEAAHAELREIGDKFDRGYMREHVTKGRVIKYFGEELATARTWLSEDDAGAVRAAISNLLAYLDPAGHTA